MSKSGRSTQRQIDHIMTDQVKKTALHHAELFFNYYVQLMLQQPLPSVPCLLQ